MKGKERKGSWAGHGTREGGGAGEWKGRACREWNGRGNETEGYRGKVKG